MQRRTYPESKSKGKVSTHKHTKGTENQLNQKIGKRIEKKKQGMTESEKIDQRNSYRTTPHENAA